MIFAIIVLLIAFLVIFVLNLPVFGKLPKGKRLQKISELKNYLDGALKNVVNTPMQPEGVTFRQLLFKFLFDKRPNATPNKALPSVIPNLNEPAKSAAPEIIWFGHSSYLIKIDGKRILVDPVFTSRSSPFKFMGPKAFRGTDIVKPNDIKNIDVLLITHDHFDHLDYSTIKEIIPQVSKVVASLGVGAHLESWGMPLEKITELAWGDEILLDEFKFTAVSARHFSGRKFKRNQTLWSAFVLETKNNKLFLGGDSGYENHFKEIGSQFGSFDIALLECGQYNEYWPYIHMFPEQTVQAAKDLNATVLMPVHWGKFSLAMHPWNEPITRAFAEAKKQDLPLATPKIGETFYVGEPIKAERWWL